MGLLRVIFGGFVCGAVIYTLFVVIFMFGIACIGVCIMADTEIFNVWYKEYVINAYTSDSAEWITFRILCYGLGAIVAFISDELG